MTAAPSRFFVVALTEGTPAIRAERIARATRGDTTLIVDGLVYGMKGEKPFSPHEPDLAGRLLDAYLARPEQFFARIDGQCTVTLVEPRRVRSFRTLFASAQIYYRDRVIGSRLVSVYQRRRSESAAPSLSRDYFARYLGGALLPYDAGITPFDGIRRLRPGEVWEAEAGRASVSVLVTPPDFPYVERRDQSAEDVAPRVRELIRDAVLWRLPEAGRGTVCQLSGGLDSSFVAALVAREVPNVPTFMYTYPNRPSHRLSERCAEQVAEKYNLSLTRVDPSEIPRTDLSAPLPYRDEPSDFFWQGAIFDPILRRLVPDGGAIFTGFGSDQLFLRDPRVIPWLLRSGRWRDFNRSLRDCARSSDRSKTHLAWQSLLVALPSRMFARIHRPFARWRLNPFNVEEIDPSAMLGDTVPWMGDLENAGQHPERDVPPGFSKLQFSYLTAPTFTTDPFSEARDVTWAHPYCDRRLIEYLMGEVSWHLVHDWKHPYKHLLREAQKGILPEEVRRREKNEFYFDGFLDRLLKDNQNYLRELLAEDSIPAAFSKAGVAKAFEALLFGVPSNSSTKMLSLIAYQQWWRDFRAAAAV